MTTSVLFSPIWSYSVHFSPIRLISVQLGWFGLILSTLVLHVPFASIHSTLILFGQRWFYSALFGPYWSYSVHSVYFGPIQSNLVIFSPIWPNSVHLILFGPLRYYMVHSLYFGPIRYIFFFFGITPIRYIESEWVSHFMRKTSTELPSDYHPNSKQVPSNFKSQLKNWTTNDTFRSKFSRTCYINPMNLVSLGLSHPNPR